MSKKNDPNIEQETPLEPEEIPEVTDTDDEIIEAEEAPKPEAELDPLEEAEHKFAQLNDRYLRLMAEYENYRKRSTKEKSDIYPQATATAVEKFLPVLDNLERAAAFERTTEDFAKGFDMICQSFAGVLQSLGVEEIGEAGEAFDPILHNAVMHIEDDSLDKNVVAQVLQKGYKIGERVIRHAMVQVAN